MVRIDKNPASNVPTGGKPTSSPASRSAKNFADLLQTDPSGDDGHAEPGSTRQTSAGPSNNPNTLGLGRNTLGDPFSASTLGGDTPALNGPATSTSEEKSTIEVGPTSAGTDLDDEFLDASSQRSENGASVQEKSAAGREPSVSTSKSSPRADLQNLLHKLVDSFRVGQNRTGAMEVQMELKNTVFDGMQIQMAQTVDGLKAILTVERYAAKGALEGQMAELTKRLESQGVEVSEIQVELAQTTREQDREGGPDDDPNADSFGESTGSEASPSLQRPRTGSAAGTNSRASRSIQSRTDYSL